MMFAAAVALVAGCSEDLTSDVMVGPNGSENVSAVADGISLEVSVEDVTRVTITGDKVNDASAFAWEVGDEITLVHNGNSHIFVAVTGGKTAVFGAKGAENVLSAVTASEPVAVFYNVKDIDKTAMTATFDVAAEQTAGELTNKMPLYAYNATTAVVENKISFKMSPLASVVDFELTANKAWNADALSLEPSFSENGTYVVASGVTVNAATGAISLANATVGNKVTVSLGSAVDFATTRNVQAVVMGLTYEKTEDALYAPVYHGKAVLKLYKNGAENVRYPIWADYAPLEDAVDEHKHIYTTIANVLKHKVADGISTAEQMKAFADAVNFTTEMYPAGAEFSNEDGVVVLKNNITLTEQNWIAIGSNGKVNPQFSGIFDGGNNTIDGLNVNYNSTAHKLTLAGAAEPSIQLNAGLFGVLAKGGVIKRLTVEGQIIVNMDNVTDWSYVGGIVAQVNGGTVQNCTSKVNITAGEYAAGKTRVGGIVGRAYCTTGDVVVRYCKNEGDINLEYESTVAASQAAFVPQIGGVIAIVADGNADYTTTVTNCENKKKVSAFNVPNKTQVGGVIGKLSKGAEAVNEFSNLHNYGAVSAGSDSGIYTNDFDDNDKPQYYLHIGGVVGELSYHTLKNCENKAEGSVSLVENNTAPYNNLNIGGVVGQTAYVEETAVIENCKNAGTVTYNDTKNNVAQPRIGGVLGFAQSCVKLDGCINSGTVTAAGGTAAQVFSGAIVGRANGSNVENGVQINDCTNSGVLNTSAKKAGTWSYAGGIVGATYGGGKSEIYCIVVDGCTNSGRVSVTNAAGGTEKFRAGGIIGVLSQHTKVQECTNSGIVALENTTVVSDFLGGIVGQLESTYGLIDACTNTGTVCSMAKTAKELDSTKGNIYTLLSGIVGNAGGTTPQVTNCVSKGYILASHDAVNDWDAANGKWKAGNNISKNYQYRTAIFGNCKASQPNSNCQVGGYVGTVKGGTGADRYDAAVTHELVNDENDTYHFKRWVFGYTTIPDLSSVTYVDVQ